MSWKKVKLGEVLNQYRIEHIVQNDTTYKQVSILNNGRVVPRGEKNGREIGRKRQFLIDLKKFPKTLIFTRQLLLQGSIGIAGSDVDNCIVTENMPMFSVIDSKIDVDYLIQFIKSREFKKQVERIELTGSAQKSIHEKTFLQLEIPLPSINEQKAIVKILQDRNSKVDAISIELTLQLNLVKKLRQQFLQEAVQGMLVPQDPSDEPASELLKKIKAEKQKLISKGKLKKEKELPPIKAEEIPFEIPNGWAWCRLGEMSINLDGQRIPVSQSDRDRKEKLFDYYGASGVIDKIDNYTHDGKFLLIGEDGANLIAKSTPIAFIAEGKFWVNNHAHVLNFTYDITMNYMTYCLNAIDIRPYITGGFQPKLSQGNLNSILIPLPPLSEQHRIVQKLDELMQMCDGLEASIKESMAQNEKLLQQVLREALRKEEGE